MPGKRFSSPRPAVTCHKSYRWLLIPLAFSCFKWFNLNYAENDWIMQRWVRPMTERQKWGYMGERNTLALAPSRIGGNGLWTSSISRQGTQYFWNWIYFSPQATGRHSVGSVING
jgi:hypothetical protein